MLYFKFGFPRHKHKMTGSLRTLPLCVRSRQPAAYLSLYVTTFNSILSVAQYDQQKEFNISGGGGWIICFGCVRYYLKVPYIVYIHCTHVAVKYKKSTLNKPKRLQCSDCGPTLDKILKGFFNVVTKILKLISFCRHVDESHFFFEFCRQFSGEFTPCDYIIVVRLATLCLILYRLHIISVTYTPRNRRSITGINMHHNII